MTFARLIAAVFGLAQAASALSPAPAACQPVHGESIVAGDLAIDNHAFAALNPHLVVGPAPMAGARREYRYPELAGLARRFGVSTAGLREACFEWQAQPLQPRALIETLARVLHCDAGAIELVDYSRFPVPPGELIFAREDLAAVPGATGRVLLWRGYVRYGVSRRLPVWARVRIALPAVRVVARTVLPPGQPIEESQVAERDITDSTVDGIFASSVRDVVGRVPVSRIEPGTPIRLAALKARPDIAAGDDVRVEVRNGSMRIYAAARAEQSGRAGDVIRLTNLQSAAHFRARVEGRGRVSLTVQPK